MRKSVAVFCLSYILSASCHHDKKNKGEPISPVREPEVLKSLDHNFPTTIAYSDNLLAYQSSLDSNGFLYFYHITLGKDKVFGDMDPESRIGVPIRFHFEENYGLSLITDNFLRQYSIRGNRMTLSGLYSFNLTGIKKENTTVSGLDINSLNFDAPASMSIKKGRTGKILASLARDTMNNPYFVTLDESEREAPVLSSVPINLEQAARLALDEEKRLAYAIAGSQVRIIDYSNARNPVVVGTKNLPSSFSDAEDPYYDVIKSQYLLRLQGGCGQIFELESLNEPVARFGDNCMNISTSASVADGRVFIKNPLYSRIEVWSIEEPKVPVHISTFSLKRDQWKIQAIDRNRVIAASNNQMDLLLLRDPRSAISIGDHLPPGTRIFAEPGGLEITLL